MLGAREKYCINSDVREAAMAPRVGGGGNWDHKKLLKFNLLIIVNSSHFINTKKL